MDIKDKNFNAISPHLSKQATATNAQLKNTQERFNRFV